MAPKKGNSSKPGAAKKQPLAVPDSDHIVFGDDKKKKKGKNAPVQETSSDPPKPTARQIVAGSSWTGKLPMNLLSELCQRQKWDKPEYSMRQVPAKDGGERMYRSDVTMSKTDPKTREKTTLPHIRLPPSDIHLADQPSALEARHFAATYTLFRIQSMKNIHMMLPPQYRDLWKGDFTRLKKQDLEAEHGWKYDEDPFAAEVKRQEIHKAMDKRREEQQKKMDALKVLEDEGQSSNVIFPIRGGHDHKVWERAPTAAMGQQIRIDTEELIRKHAVWNQHGLILSKQERSNILLDITKLGFRPSHVEEALDYCKDQQEVLEWLLVHIPEDDLPRWTFPPNYNAGLTLASGNLAKEKKLKRLTLGGYPSELCAQALRSSDEDENRAAFSLQQILVPDIDCFCDTQPDSMLAWKEEIETLEAIFGENLISTTDEQCSIKMSTTSGTAFTAHFRCPRNGYPQSAVPAISIEITGIPAYIRLSATKKAVKYAYTDLLGEVMLYSICQWLETELPSIIENPGRLSELRLNPPKDETIENNTINGKGGFASEKSGTYKMRRPQKIDRRSGVDVLELWKLRQAKPEQVKMLEVRRRLPAWAKRTEIVQAITERQITIISGETGSGKSTQVVQFILDNAISNSAGHKTNILCTQPRRVATLSLADRVSNERCSQVGDEVGYMIRGESKVSNTTKITFMTTGVLLRRLQSHENMNEALANVSHIFIDEVHERSLDTDFLLALLKECLLTQPQIKIVLMSATLDAEIFSTYFGGPSKVALVNIEGRTFPVRDLHLEDVIELTKPNMSTGELGKTIQNLGFGINYDLISEVVSYIDQELASQEGAILVFLPGTLEIERCLKSLSGNAKILGLPLHASLLPADQRKVFPRAPAGLRKVIAATNVAETSITIEDVVAVIDTGRVKETRYDTENNFVRLEEVWASQAACKQRRGRAGRVRAGVCYKLFTKNIETRMVSKTMPEIQRVPLEQLCLSVKASGPHRDVAKFLSETLTPPDSGAITNALRTLHAMNALENDRLTALGTYLALIPADLRCAKLLVYGTVFDCLEACLTIASILTVKSPFVNPREKRDEANEARMSFSGVDGDLILDMRAYNEWANLNQNLRYGQLMDWCQSHFISQQTMRDITSTRRQILDSLKDAGLVPLEYRSPAHEGSASKKTEDTILLTALIAASLQPQIAQISFPSKKYIASMTGAKELDPEAKTIKFFVPDETTMPISKQSTPTSSRAGTPKPPQPTTTSLSRVFVHPASCLFSAQTFPRHSTHLSYFTKMVTSKPFIRDLTPLNIYSLLLFGGKLVVETTGRGLIVDGIWRVQGWARIGVLVSRLRVLLDEELKRTVESGGVLLGSMKESEVVKLVRRLLTLNGQDQ